MNQASIDPCYYDGEYSGHWIKSPDYELVNRYIDLCENACRLGVACWLPKYDPDVPF